MTGNQADNVRMLRSAFGKVAPPDKITQEAFEGNDQHLRRLVRLRAGERAKPDDLWEYIHDLRHTDIQSSLLAYLLPFCFEVWREDLRGLHNGYGGVIEYLYPVLVDRHIFDKHLTPKQSGAVSEFMRQTILEEIDDQRGLTYQGSKARPYRWIGALTTYGVLLPEMDSLWNEWWSLKTLGRAVAALQYISCLLYPENENPVFAPWTQDRGGGPPCLWEFEGHLYTHRWLELNVTFLKKVLNIPRVSEVFSRAVKCLVGQREHDVAALMQEDFPLCIATLEARCAELPLLLETIEAPSSLRECSK